MTSVFEIKILIFCLILIFIFFIITRLAFESLQRAGMSEIESKISPNVDAEKSYEAVQMLNTENDDDGIDKEKGSNKASDERITLRRVFLKNYMEYCSKTSFLGAITEFSYGIAYIRNCENLLKLVDGKIDN